MEYKTGDLLINRGNKTLHMVLPDNKKICLVGIGSGGLKIHPLASVHDLDGRSRAIDWILLFNIGERYLELMKDD